VSRYFRLSYFLTMNETHHQDSGLNLPSRIFGKREFRGGVVQASDALFRNTKVHINQFIYCVVVWATISWITQTLGAYQHYQSID